MSVSTTTLDLEAQKKQFFSGEAYALSILMYTMSNKIMYLRRLATMSTRSPC
jgi:hypothetical protein